MLPVFRKIRFQLAKDNQFFNYGRYAVGEIVLVVIGILIALQNNSWNQSKENEKLKAIYLQRLIHDVEQDTLIIRNVQKEIGMAQSVISDFIRSMESTGDMMSRESIVEKYFERGWIISEFVPVKNTYIQLSQTGNMKMLKNTTLIDEIISYYRFIQQLENSNAVNKNWITPIDQQVAVATAAFELDPATRPLFESKNRKKAIENILENADLMERNAAGHFWINQSLSNNMRAINGLSLHLLKSLKDEMKKTNN